MEIDYSSGTALIGPSASSMDSFSHYSDASSLSGWLNRTFDKDSYNLYKSTLEYERNALESQKNRDFQEYMSNTSYQRAVADMKKAGINPILAVQNGGSSTPSGSVSSYSDKFDSSGISFKELLSGLASVFSGLIHLI